MRQYEILSYRPQVSRNLFSCDEKQETQSLNMKITDFGYLRINLSSLRQY